MLKVSQEVDNTTTLLTIFNVTLLYQFVDFELSTNFDFLFQQLCQKNTKVIFITL